MLEDHFTPHGKKYFVNLSWVVPCCEQKLGIGAQAMCIACNDTSVIVINFRKSKTHAITDTYCTVDVINRGKAFSRLYYELRHHRLMTDDDHDHLSSMAFFLFLSIFFFQQNRKDSGSESVHVIWPKVQTPLDDWVKISNHDEEQVRLLSNSIFLLLNILFFCVLRKIFTLQLCVPCLSKTCLRLAIFSWIFAIQAFPTWHPNIYTWTKADEVIVPGECTI